MGTLRLSRVVSGIGYEKTRSHLWKREGEVETTLSHLLECLPLYFTSGLGRNRLPKKKKKFYTYFGYGLSVLTTYFIVSHTITRGLSSVKIRIMYPPYTD